MGGPKGPPTLQGGPLGPPSDFSDFWLQSHPLLTPHPLTLTGHRRGYFWGKIRGLDWAGGPKNPKKTPKNTKKRYRYRYRKVVGANAFMLFCILFVLHFIFSLLFIVLIIFYNLIHVSTLIY